MTRYAGFLREKRLSEQQREVQKNSVPFAINAGYGREMRYTGDGSPNDVAEYTRNGVPIHKGEIIFGGGNGSVITDATTSRELSSNPIINDRIGGRVNGFKCGGYKKGYQTGGYANDTKSDIEPNRPQRLPQNINQNYIPPINDVTRNTTDTPVAPTVQPTQGADYLRSKGLAAISNILEGGATAGRVAGQKRLSDLKSTQDVERQVMKQELAQKGADESVARSQMARLRGEQEGQLAEAETAIGIEGMQAKERAAGTLAAEGAREADIEMARKAQSLNEKQFDEYVRQFEVGSDQWDKAFLERRKQFEVGSDQWNKTYELERDYKWKTFEEDARRFEVGTEQWEKARQDQLGQWQKSFDEQRRQFEVGSEQWQKSFNEERRRYDNEDDRWWSSFDEQRRQFEVGSKQWEQSFNEQKRQFDVGSAQWNKAHDLQVREFQRQLNMDNFTVEQWKDNISFRNKAYLDTRSDAVARLEMERDVHEKNMKVLDMKIDATKATQESELYWQGSERVFNYVSTHLSGFNETTQQFSPDAEEEMLKWSKTKYPGFLGGFDSVAQLKASNPAKYAEFKNWAVGEWKAASDNRLTNPYDKMVFDVNSSKELDPAAKKVILEVLNSPEALAQIAGIEYDPNTNAVSITQKGTTPPNQATQPKQQPKIAIKPKKESGPVGPGPRGGI